MKKILILSFLIISSITTLFAQCMEASSDEGVNVVGFLQSQFEYKLMHEDLDDESSFTFGRARLGVVGNIPYDFSYYVMFEFSPHQGGPYLIDGFMTYSRLDPYAKISFGRFKSPFGLEMNTPCQSLHTIRRSIVVNTLVYPDRDMGIIINGKYDKYLKYSLGFTNGTQRGEITDLEDDNMNKTFTGRLVVMPHEMISIGGSYRFGTAAPIVLGEPDDERTRIGGELEFKYDEFLLQAEYVQSEDVGSYTTGGG